MFPTFEIGDQLAVDKISVKFSRPYQRKDVVVFRPPPAFREFSDLPAEEVSDVRRRSEETTPRSMPSLNRPRGSRAVDLSHPSHDIADEAKLSTSR